MKVFYAPGASSLGIRILLEEIGAPYEAELLNVRAGEGRTPAFLAINPKGKIPTLMLDDGAVLTEFAAIATYLGVTNMGAGLLPMDALLIARIMEAMSYIADTIHGKGFTRVFFPASFSANPAEKDAVQAKGRQIITAGFDLLADSLGGQEYLAGEFSLADAALFFITFWGKTHMKLALPAVIEAHYARMLTRPAVQRAMQAENLI
jgi:glutathione S-transferase